jgi:hypothetical protein
MGPILFEKQHLLPLADENTEGPWIDSERPSMPGRAKIG